MIPGHSIFELPGVVHFYSYATGVSFELPAGFHAVAEGEASAAYAEDDAGDPAQAVRLEVRVVGRLEAVDPEAAVAALADGFAAQPGKLVARRSFRVDDAPAQTAVIARPDGGVLHASALAGEGRLLSVVAQVPAARAESAIAELDRALASVRLVWL